MTAASNSTAAAAAAAAAAATVSSGINQGKTPIPYLFGGLALMLALIATALAILGCSYKRRRPNEDAKATTADQARAQPEMEPKIVVIVPGYELPRYLAKPATPAASSTFHADQV